MIRKFKEWLYKNYLPKITMQTYLSEMESIKAANAALSAENKELRRYIEGMEYAIRRGSKITINNEVNGNHEE